MTVLLYVLIAFLVISIITENSKFCIASLVFIFLAFICVCVLSNNKEPSKLYQEKIEAVEKANKELEKFLIDYPEFKEE